MKTNCRAVVISLIILGAANLRADYYAAQNNQTPIFPYDTLAGAASNIQEAVAQAAAGDTVWVGPGQYKVPPTPTVRGVVTNIVDMPLPVTLRSSSGNPEDTIIDGEGLYRCVWMGALASQSQPYILDGFTITNGMAKGSQTGSGGVYIYNGSALTSNAVVRNCMVVDNHVADPHGYGSAGGIYVSWVYSLTQDFTFMVSNCVVRGNSTNGIYTSSYSANGASIIADCLIEDNIGSGAVLGGGTFWSTIDNTVFRNNVKTSGYGAGLNISRPVVMKNCLFYGNKRWVAGVNYTGGAAIYDQCKTNIMINCTIVSNTCSSGGKAHYQHWNTKNHAFLYNTVVYSNYSEIYGVADSETDSSSDYSFGHYVVFTNCLRPGATGSGNVTKFPEFWDLAGGDARLRPWSSGIDVGLVQPWMSTATDLAGNPRVSANGLVDMGCYETSIEPRPIHYVAQNGQTPTAPYTNLTMAASNIQDAVESAALSDTEIVLIGPGRYTAPSDAPYFIGTNVVYVDRSLILRGATGNPADVILDGEGANRGIAFHYPLDSGDQFIVDGLTVSNCFATNCGGGILFNAHNHDWTGQVWNCDITHNTVEWGNNPGYFYNTTGSRGGGIGSYNNSCLFGITVSNTVIRNNEARHKGPGLGVGSSGGAVSVRGNGEKRFVDCVVRNNHATSGGGFSLSGGSTFFENCIINNNVADVLDSGLAVHYAGGGAIEGGGVQLHNCLLYRNRSNRGAMYLTSGGSYVYNSTIVSNRAYGGINMRFVRHANNSNLHIWNSIICSNGSYDVSIDSYTNLVGELGMSMTNSCLINGNSEVDKLNLFIPPHNNISADPDFVNFAGNNYRPKKVSPCVNTGTNMSWMAGNTELEGRDRIDAHYGIVDMGPYEYSYGATTVLLR